MRFYTQTQISEHIAETREGFLVCAAVPIARTGIMEYGPHETPVEPGPDGVVRVERPESAVFDPDSMGTFEGKPGTINHPAEDVTPANWKRLAVGHAQNIRRGAGEASDLLLADLIITDAKAISLIRGGLREISCGYDADYEQIAPGHGRQSNIRGNHIALVHRGRCGSRCRINDASEDTMSKKKNTVLDTLKDFLKKPEVVRMLDEETADPPEPEKDAPAADAPDDLAALKARVNELEIQVRSLAGSTGDDSEKDKPVADDEQPPEPDVPDKEKTADAAMARTVDADTQARAKVLMPGLVVHDSDQRCAVQRAALRSATANDANVGTLVASTLSGSTLDNCDCVTLDAAFLAASELVKVKHNQATADGLTGVSVKDFGKVVTPADINRLNSEFHKKGA